MKIVWSKKAEDKLDTYLTYCQENYGDKVTNDKINNLEKLLSHLSMFPEMGFVEPILKDKKPNYRAYIFDKRLKLIYYIDNKNTIIKIADIWNNKQNPNNLKKDL